LALTRLLGRLQPLSHAERAALADGVVGKVVCGHCATPFARIVELQLREGRRRYLYLLRGMYLADGNVYRAASSKRDSVRGGYGGRLRRAYRPVLSGAMIEPYQTPESWPALAECPRCQRVNRVPERDFRLDLVPPAPDGDADSPPAHLSVEAVEGGVITRVEGREVTAEEWFDEARDALSDFVTPLSPDVDEQLGAQ
jgi:hypothetical protein